MKSLLPQIIEPLHICNACRCSCRQTIPLWKSTVTRENKQVSCYYDQFLYLIDMTNLSIQEVCPLSQFLAGSRKPQTILTCTNTVCIHIEGGIQEPSLFHCSGKTIMQNEICYLFVSQSILTRISELYPSVSEQTEFSGDVSQAIQDFTLWQVS